MKTIRGHAWNFTPRFRFICKYRDALPDIEKIKKDLMAVFDRGEVDGYNKANLKLNLR